MVFHVKREITGVFGAVSPLRLRLTLSDVPYGVRIHPPWLRSTISLVAFTRACVELEMSRILNTGKWRFHVEHKIAINAPRDSVTLANAGKLCGPTQKR